MMFCFKSEGGEKKNDHNSESELSAPAAFRAPFAISSSSFFWLILTIFRITKGLLHGKEWQWTGDILCLTKEEILHREVAAKFWSKICTCAPGKRCVLNKIKAVGTDFENGLWKPFLEELHKHQR